MELGLKENACNLISKNDLITSILSPVNNAKNLFECAEILLKIGINADDFNIYNKKSKIIKFFIFIISELKCLLYY